MADKIRKLSEAIRLGATFRPQCRLFMFDGNGNSCALGAAFEAVTGKHSTAGTLPYYSLMERFGVNDETLIAIGHMNDNGASRESIADWLEAQGL